MGGKLRRAGPTDGSGKWAAGRRACRGKARRFADADGYRTATEWRTESVRHGRRRIRKARPRRRRVDHRQRRRRWNNFARRGSPSSASLFVPHGRPAVARRFRVGFVRLYLCGRNVSMPQVARARCREVVAACLCAWRCHGCARLRASSPRAERRFARLRAFAGIWRILRSVATRVGEAHWGKAPDHAHAAPRAAGIAPPFAVNRVAVEGKRSPAIALLARGLRADIPAAQRCPKPTPVHRLVAERIARPAVDRRRAESGEIRSSEAKA